jgi:hypothetical protein
VYRVVSRMGAEIQKTLFCDLIVLVNIYFLAVIQL